MALVIFHVCALLQSAAYVCYIKKIIIKQKEEDERNSPNRTILGCTPLSEIITVVSLNAVL